MLTEGDKVPAFELMDASGNATGSGALKGKKYVVYFYPKDFTSGCTVEADEFSKAYDEFRKRGVEVVGISPDSVESHGKFCKKMGIPYVLLADTDKKVAEAFGVWGKKKFMGREYMGVNRSTFLVDERGTVFKVYSKVRPAGHAKDVLEKFGRGSPA
ncbi:MAG: thioredoxin-dependent thiol peroxidase [Thaumarchaeota archaeon]|nr:thioredoxin-dependent thiol peroxidase [Nitrososphaerota archaeon]MDE0266352.1 thioredoxin-dependent thiol peroxidase [Nitrososphaerota archaeon]